MRKFLFLVLTITASVAFASPPVQDEKLPDPVVKVPVVEKEPNEEHTEAEAGPLVQDEAVADSRLELDSVLLEPETTEEQRLPEETQVMLEKLVLEADNLTEEIVETELGPELETTDFQKDSNIIPELESETNTEEEDEKEENLVKEEPTLEADYIMNENPEIQMDPGRQSRMTQNGWGTCRGVVLQGKCYQYFRVHLNAYQAEFHCQSICYNGHLASVSSSYILGELGRLMDRNGGRTRTWLGGWRIFNTLSFMWLDGTHWLYNGWAVGEPNNAGGHENCVETWYNLAFNDAPCTIPKPFICSCPL
ncbi:bone marrow proteoglycan-like [Carassius gibelio]|uniref:bone marrow proteoglycan-like n=1 Tax=Carassius gibelio TaxID=101364 RepID=UPI002279CFBE|nr:bone marrow proteoglycan-like [Carassius gibelio]